MNLVTGATGILGSHVVLKLLQNNKPVIACKQKKSDLSKIEKLFSYFPEGEKLFRQIAWREMDVNDVYSIEDALEGVETVYHCAGHVSFNDKDRKKLFKINETGTSNVVTACLNKKITALCYASTIATLNNSDYTQPIDENVFWKLNGKESDYALSKYGAEREVWRGIEEGLNAVIVNPGIILSPGFWNQSSSKLFTRCYNGNKFYTNGLAPYISAQDVATVMIKLIEKKQFANRYILVEGNYTFREIVDTILVNFGKPKATINANRFILNLARFFENLMSAFGGKEQLLSRNTINSAFHVQTYVNTKIKEAINYDFMPVNKVIKDICRIFEEERREYADKIL